MTYDIMKDPHICKDQKKLALRLRKEPWGKVVMGLGMEPYHTESSARTVASHAAEITAERDTLRRDLLRAYKTIKVAQQLIDAANDLLMAATGPEDGPTSWKDTRLRLQAMVLAKGFKLAHTVPEVDNG